MKKMSSRSNTIDAKFLSFAVPAVWESAERGVGNSKKVNKVNGVMHIDGNVLLTDLERVLEPAVLGKMRLNYTGSVPIKHKNDDQLIDNMKKNSKSLNQVKFRNCICMNSNIFLSGGVRALHQTKCSLLTAFFSSLLSPWNTFLQERGLF